MKISELKWWQLYFVILLGVLSAQMIWYVFQVIIIVIVSLNAPVSMPHSGASHLINYITTLR